MTVRAGIDSDRRRELLGALGVDLATAGDVLGLTAAIPDPEAKPGPLRHPVVMEALASAAT